MYVHVCICIYMYIHVCMYVCMYVCRCMHVCMYVLTYVAIYKHMYVSMYMYIYIYMCVCVCVCVVISSNIYKLLLLFFNILRDNINTSSRSTHNISMPIIFNRLYCPISSTEEGFRRLRS
jgi:hypothetical protein